MKLKNLTIFISLIFFLFCFSCNYNNENSEQKSQGKIKKEKQTGENYFKKKPSLPSKGKIKGKKVRNLEDKLRDLFTLDEVSPIKGFLKKLQELFMEFSKENFETEFLGKETKDGKNERKKESRQ